MNIEKKNCMACGKDTDTKIVCDECHTTMSKSQIQKSDKIFQRTVIELFNNKCVDCNFSAETESGELCADHLQQKNTDPTMRYDLANAVCRCVKCHNGRHDASVERVPDEKKLPKKTAKKQKKFEQPVLCKIMGCPRYAIRKGLCCRHI